ncbi:putative F-box domain, leucine-rich repeat domain superfamily, F-box-like domain superfamily [Helianthus annuus]|uniref:F-box domain, leucine-rich repeat domain superfamily, F-box-like domain superfamily n=3 Tax=Helianthus annuus TaxID=4232 RepID=A0A9K3H970_HELAN|nr:putative F-box/LRR-repeat protein 23 isoform X2 [Helianthus annuus]KAF5770771.1 putative F-box domain, leucine-rich repeat domain superfamily, F-box-like domain superfamily [Helianthus annuus]KAJ0465640.1 putative F-box domain, leucine-rich repeat domain superfamily, F-box-like domain superfamily [Helianthus annuus]KAJ0470510.1 putative F-box domain, leucine-rich repeat domain superfamily, F-box-like domain superfamily [Helianthus annuus]KAJ0487233.1 putative F-box domain, leucine-rich repea
MVPSKLNLKQEKRNWLDLPSDVTANILNRIGMVDILENAQKVCTAWRKICKDPAMWRVINMNDLRGAIAEVSADKMCKHAVDRSQGQLVDITIVSTYDAELHLYVADRTSELRRLEMAHLFFFGKLTTVALMKYPLLEELNLYEIRISKEEIETVGRYCPMLKTLKVNKRGYEGSLTRYNEIAIAIGQNLPGIRHLELIGNKMTNVGLRVILDNCHHLETLDLRECLYIDLEGDLGKQCSKQIKYLKLPNDSLEDYPYIYLTESEYFNDDYYYVDAYEVST